MDRLLADIIDKHLRGEPLSAEEQLAFDRFKNYLLQRMDEAATAKAFEAFQRTAFGEFVPAGELPVITAPVIPAPVISAPVISIPSRVRRLSRRWLAAAAVLLVAGASLLFYRQLRPFSQETIAKQSSGKIRPGSQGAVLTLSNGQQVVLDSLGSGLVATQNGTNVTLDSGKLTYTKEMAGLADASPDKPAAAVTGFNTISTPRGRKFQLTLPDGTRVWLNAASKLSFPTAFTGSERRVSVSGEVYFEVAKDAAKPFKVTVNDKTAIEVLGTNFNVEAYTDDTRTRTTLLEGSVRVSGLRDGVILKPGEQASSTTGSAGIEVVRADADKVMAWKNDLFNFEGATLVEVMNQVARWYDMDIVYEKGIPPFEFGGKIRRDMTLDHLLEFLGGAGVHFRIEGRRLIVLP
jgi:ferric-dicitrate binding protein FerR (iron transport regulator)